jgi:hypothetical protein
VAFLVELAPEGAKLLYATAKPAPLAAVEADRREQAAAAGLTDADLAEHIVRGPWLHIISAADEESD